MYKYIYSDEKILAVKIWDSLSNETVFLLFIRMYGIAKKQLENYRRTKIV